MCHTFIANRRGHVRPGSSGTVVPGYEAKLVDDAGREVALGEVGNLMVKGDSACSCYWNQHERTKQTIEGEWVRTGDKYHRDADGYFWYAGRTDDMIKAGGMWVSPAEVEGARSEEHTSELQSLTNLVCRLLLEKKKGSTPMPSRRAAHRDIQRES